MGVKKIVYDGKTKEGADQILFFIFENFFIQPHGKTDKVHNNIVKSLFIWRRSSNEYMHC